MRKLIDQQLRRNDDSISAIKTVCNLLGVNIPRDVIEDNIQLDEGGATIPSIQKFLDDHGFDTNIKLLDINSINGNYADFKSDFPCIAPIKNGKGCHYVVLNDIHHNKFSVLDPAKVKEYKISFQEFKKQAHYDSSSLSYVKEEEILEVKIRKELKKRNIQLKDNLAKVELIQLSNKLNYFLYIYDNYGFKTEKAGNLFLKDLIFNQDITNIPEQFKSLDFNNGELELKAPILLTVQKTAQTVDLPEEKSPNVYWRLFKSIYQIKDLVYIFLMTTMISSFIAYVAVFIDQILIDHILPSYQLQTLQLFAIGVGVFYLIDTIFKIYKKFISIHLASTLDRFFLGTFDQKLNSFSIRYLSTFKKGDLTERLSDSMKLKTFFVKFITQILVNVFISCVSLIFLVFINWQLTFLVLIVLVIFMIIFYVFTPIIERLEKIRYTRKAAFMSKFIEKIEGIEVIKSLGLEHYSSQQIKSRIDDLIDIYVKSKYIGLANSIITSLVVSFSLLALIVLTSREMILYNSISLGMIITYIALSSKIFKAFGKLLDHNLALQEHKVILKRFFDFDEQKSSLTEAEQELNGKAKSNGKNYFRGNKIKDFELKHLELKDISFGYNSEKQILNKVSFGIESGDKIWIQGKNGSGKSTICKMISKMYQPDSGDFMINDIDSSMYDDRQIRNKINLISGKDLIFNDTILFNITFGRRVDLKELIEYAKFIDLYDFIHEKPDKFNFVLHENGKNLSTGQKRKILLLRALMSDAKLVMLDEIFNGMDQESKEKAETLIDMTFDKTWIIISHMPVKNITFDKQFKIAHGILTNQNA